MRARAHGAHLEPGGLGRSLPAFGHHDWRVHAVLAQLKVLKPRSLPVQRVARGAERGRGRPLHTCTVVSTASLVHNHGIARCVTTGVSGGRAKARTARQYCTHLIFLRAAADIAKARRGRGRTDAAHCNRTGARARPSIWRRSLARCSLRLVACPRQDAALFGRRLLPADGTGELSVSPHYGRWQFQPPPTVRAGVRPTSPRRRSQKASRVLFGAERALPRKQVSTLSATTRRLVAARHPILLLRQVEAQRRGFETCDFSHAGRGRKILRTR